MKKLHYISHYLVLRDLTNEIESIKDISKETSYSHYKPYILKPTENNILKAKKLLERFASKKVLNFLEFGKITNHNQKLKPTNKANR